MVRAAEDPAMERVLPTEVAGERAAPPIPPPAVGIGFTRPTAPPIVGPVGLGVALAVIVAGFFVPRLLDDPFRVGLAVDGLLLGLVALAVAFLIHTSGLVSIGHAAFFGGSAYLVAIGTSRWDWHPLTAVVVAFVLSTAFAFAVGALIVRVPGIAFAVITIAVGQALYVLCVQPRMRQWTNGFDGLGVRYDGTIFGWGPAEFGDAETVWPLVWGIVAAISMTMWLVTRSRWGLTLAAIRENEERARFCGISTFVPRLLAFVLSSMIASIAGILFALRTAFVAPQNLHWSLSADALVAAIVGGVASVIGPIIGALVYVFGRDRFAASGEIQLYTGIALVVMLVLAPRGLAGLVQSLGRRIRRPTRRAS